MASEAKADWEKEAERIRDDLKSGYAPLSGWSAIHTKLLANNLRSAHAAGAREAEEKLGGAMVVVDACVAWQEDTGGCHFCGFGLRLGPPVEETMHNEDCPLVEQGFILRDGSRVGGKETK